MLLEPGERHESAAQLTADLEQVARAENSTVLIARRAAASPGTSTHEAGSTGATGTPPTW